jgi:hypothetical protein
MPDDNSPATKHDLQLLRQEFKQDLHDMEGRLTDRLTEAMRDMQSELLRGFAAFSEIELRLGRA